MEIWTVYDHPDDFPGFFVARKWLVQDKPVPTDQVLIDADLAPLRRILSGMGLTSIPRFPGDDRSIVETWL